MSFAAKVKRVSKSLLKRVKGLGFEEEIYEAVIRPGDVIFDIGAYVGGVSLFTARLSKPKGQVIAFEPVWSSYIQLCRNIQSDIFGKSLIVPVPFGVAETEKTALVQVPINDGGASCATTASREAWSEYKKKKTAFTSVNCSFVSIDGFLKEKNVAGPNFIKIDVEGGELFVFRGASRMFESGNRPLMFIEVFAPLERTFGYTPWDVLSLLKSYGYRFFFMCPEGLIDHDPSLKMPFPPEYVGGYNIIAYCDKDHTDRIRNLKRLLMGARSRSFKMSPPPQPNYIGA